MLNNPYVYNVCNHMLFPLLVFYKTSTTCMNTSRADHFLTLAAWINKFIQDITLN